MQREDCREEFWKKIFNGAEEIARLDMGARNQYSSINFLSGFIEGISMVNIFGAISTLLFWVAGKASGVPKVRSLNNF